MQGSGAVDTARNMDPPRRPGLTARFAVAGVVAFVVAGVVLAVTVLAQVRAGRSAEAQDRAAYVTDAVIGHELSPADVAAPMRGTSYDRMLKLVRSRVLGSWSIDRVNIWRPDGTIVFS